jgi:hypothetical protein
MSRYKTIHNFINNKEMTRKEFITFMGIFIISMFGIVEIIKRIESSMAATPYTSSEAETGILGGAASKVLNSSASGGQYVKFGGATPPPPPTGGKIVVGTWDGNDTTKSDSSLNFVGANPTASAMQAFVWNPPNAQAIQALSGFAGTRIWAEIISPSWAQDSTVLNGQYDSYFKAAAQSCKSLGIKIIRLGWEFNTGGAGPWTGCRASWFVANWKHIFNIYNTVAPGYFSFIWNPDKGNTETSDSIMSYYPGKAYMGNPGVVAMDAYTSYQAAAGAAQLTFFANNFQWNQVEIVKLALQNGHETAFMEWSNRSDQWGVGVDDGAYVTACMDWAASAVNATGSNCYMMMWNDGFPNTSMPPSWTFNSNPRMVSAMKASIIKYRSAGLIT